MMVARQGCGDEVKYLHRAGADINIRNIYGNTAVMYAAQSSTGMETLSGISTKWGQTSTSEPSGVKTCRHCAVSQTSTPRTMICAVAVILLLISCIVHIFLESSIYLRVLYM